MGHDGPSYPTTAHLYGRPGGQAWGRRLRPVKERRIKIQPIREMGTTDDVAAAVCFLASDLAGFITGQILHVDGGKSCGRLSL